MMATEAEAITIDPELASPPASPPTIIGGTALPMTNPPLAPVGAEADAEVTISQMKTEHLGRSRQYWRDIILGVNDGLVSTFLLVAGVAGGGMSSEAILLTALAGALAGAISMMAG